MVCVQDFWTDGRALLCITILHSSINLNFIYYLLGSYLFCKTSSSMSSPLPPLMCSSHASFCNALPPFSLLPFITESRLRWAGTERLCSACPLLGFHSSTLHSLENVGFNIINRDRCRHLFRCLRPGTSVQLPFLLLPHSHSFCPAESLFSADFLNLPHFLPISILSMDYCLVL